MSSYYVCISVWPSVDNTKYHYHYDVATPGQRLWTPELWLATRSIKVLHTAAPSSNPDVKTTVGMLINGTSSVMGGNIRHLKARYDLSCTKVVEERQVIHECHTDK